MKVYLVEVVVDGILQPIAIKTNWELASYLVNGKNGRITEMIMDKEYFNGIQICFHWNFFEKNNRSGRMEQEKSKKLKDFTDSGVQWLLLAIGLCITGLVFMVMYILK